MLLFSKYFGILLDKIKLNILYILDIRYSIKIICYTYISDLYIYIYFKKTFIYTHIDGHLAWYESL